MLEDSTGVSRRDVCHSAGEEDLVCRSTFWDDVPEQGSELVEAMRPRIRHERADAPRARKALLPCAAEAAEAEGVIAAPDIAPEVLDPVGWEGGPDAAAAALDRPRQVAPDPVVVPLDEVKTKALPPTGRKEVWSW